MLRPFSTNTIVRTTFLRRFNSTTTQTAAPIRPLEGIRVLELGQLIAGPFCGSILGYYGAEVIKVEPPKVGDPLRTWRQVDHDGVSPWFRSIGRNKKSICVDLRTDEGRSLIKGLAQNADVLIENFKPGTMEKWGLGPDDLYATNPGLIFTRISGYGQTGPYSNRPGFASVCEGMGGFRYVNGIPGLPPVRPNISLGDSLAGMHAALGVLLSLIGRNKLGQAGQKKTGQVVDVAIYESMLNMMESIIPEYDRKGVVREMSGSTVTGVVPTNTYPCKDNAWVIIGGNGDSIYKRLMTMIGREDLIGPEYETNADRVKKQEEIDGAIGEWTARHTPDDVLEKLAQVSVPAGKIYSAKDLVQDEHIIARGMIEQVTVGTEEEGRGWQVKVPGMSPVLHGTPGSTQWAGPDLGQDTAEVLSNELGLCQEELDGLRIKGVIN